MLEGDDRPPERSDATFDASVPTTVTLTLDLLPGASGTVTSAPAGFNCTGNDTTCAAAFDANATVTLTATPASGQTFLGWGGACAGTSTCVVSAADGLLVTAAFSAPGSATITYYHTDMVGSVRAITDASGAALTRLDYFPFGESTASLTGDPKKFLGQERDAETAFDYLGARYYRNVWGRFTSVDPVVSAGAVANPQLWNRYAYGLNSPLRFSDPSGMEPDEPADKSSALPNLACDFCGDVDSYNSWLFQQSFNQLFPKPGEEQIPTPGGTSDERLIQAFKAAFSLAMSALNNPGCAILFGGRDAALAGLMLPRYSFMPMRLDWGAYTIPSNGISPTFVRINPAGGLVNGMVFDGRYRPPSWGAGLTVQEIGATILLHELGHVVGKFESDAGDSPMNLKYTQQVIAACFPRK